MLRSTPVSYRILYLVVSALSTSEMGHCRAIFFIDLEWLRFSDYKLNWDKMILAWLFCLALAFQLKLVAFIILVTSCIYIQLKFLLDSVSFPRFIFSEVWQWPLFIAYLLPPYNQAKANGHQSQDTFHRQGLINISLPSSSATELHSLACKEAFGEGVGDFDSLGSANFLLILQETVLLCISWIFKFEIRALLPLVQMFLSLFSLW